MHGMEAMVQEGFNTQLRTLRALSAQFPERDYEVSLTYFDHEVDHRICSGHVKDLQPLGRGDYLPNGSTALLDAMGSAIGHTRERYHARQRTGEVTAVLVVITDGAENASRHYGYSAIARMVKDCEATGRWTFTFLGADFDASDMASRMSLHRDHCVSFSKADYAKTMEKLGKRMEVYERRKSNGVVMQSLFRDTPADEGPRPQAFDLPRDLRL